jgi:hypothetical protein
VVGVTAGVVVVAAGVLVVVFGITGAIVGMVGLDAWDAGGGVAGVVTGAVAIVVFGPDR